MCLKDGENPLLNHENKGYPHGEDKYQVGNLVWDSHPLMRVGGHL